MSVDDTPAPQTQDPVATDTSEQTDTSETSTQNNETPEATPAVEEKQTAEVKAEDTVEGKLYAGKYKTVEDMEKAYTELQSKYGQTNSEKAELARILNDAFLSPEPTAPQGAPSQDIEEGYQDETTVNPKIEQLERKSAVQSFILSHPEADPQTMQKVLSEDPLIQQISGHEAKLEYAYLRSQNMTKSQAIEEAEKKGAEATLVKTAEKQAAQVETAKQQAQPTGDDNELSQSQLREKLKDDKAFDDIISKKFPGISKMKTRR